MKNNNQILEPKSNFNRIKDNLYSLRTETEDNETKIDWVILTFMILIHIVALIGGLFYFSWANLFGAIFLYWLFSGVGIGFCFHRLLSHRSFTVSQWLESILVILGTLSYQGSPIFWVGNHRMHHAHCDTAKDPYNATLGFFWSHVVWTLYRRNSIHFDYKVYSKYVPELTEKPLCRFLHQWTVELQLFLALCFYIVGGWSLVIYGCFVRLVISWHLTWLVNSACHLWGKQPFEVTENANNLWWVALLTFGEGWHNTHHAYPKSARYGLMWWQIDMNYGLIWVLQKLRLAEQVCLKYGNFSDY